MIRAVSKPLLIWSVDGEHECLDRVRSRVAVSRRESGVIVDRGGVGVGGGGGVHGLVSNGHGHDRDGDDDGDVWYVGESVKNIDCSIHLLVLGFYFASYNQPKASVRANVLVELEDMWMVDCGMVDFVLCLVLNSKLLWQQVYLSILAAVGLCF